MLAVDEDGKIVLESPHQISLSPNGNGAFFDAVLKHAHIQKALRATEYIQIVGVDNILCKIFDPLYIGMAVKDNLTCAMKAITKKDWKESLGVAAMKNGKLDIIEYT